MDRFVATNGIRLHYVDYEGDGPVLVLAHGLTANAHSFEGLMAAGLGATVRVIAVDLRGRGLSDHPPSGYLLQHHVDDMVGLLDALGLEEVSFGGHSFGGYVAYLMAAQHPERVRHCIAIDAPSEPDPGILDQIRPVLERLEVVFPSLDAYLDHVRSMPWFVGKWSEQYEAFYRSDVEELADGSVRSRARPAAMLEAAEDTLAVDMAGTVASIRRPTLLVRAVEPLVPGAPLIFPEDTARRALASLEHGTMVDVPGNHYDVVLGGAAVETTAAIVAFLEGAAGP